MRRIPIPLLALLTAAAALAPGLVPVPAVSAPMRGAWVSGWSAGYFTPQQVDVTVAAAKSAGVNALFIQVRKNADAYYTPGLEPRASEVSGSFDPLAYVIEKAHAVGIEVHAWMNACRVWTSRENPADATHIVNSHPDWLNKDVTGSTRSSEGLYLDPGVPAARDHVVAVAVDIAKRYAVDGIHLDYIRYPGSKWGYSDTALSRYAAETGISTKPEPTDARWLQWRRAQVTELVRDFSRQVRAVNPDVILSAATIPWGDCPEEYTSTSPYVSVCQDWKRWFDEDLLDANVPMNYKKESNEKNARQFRNWLAGFKRWSGGKKVWVGIDIHENDVAGVRSQMNAVSKAGLDGTVWFSFNASQKRTALVEAMGGYVPSEQPGERAAKGSGNPESQAAFDRGIRYAMHNQLGMAKVELGRAVELDPSFAEAQFRLGRCYLRERNTRRAEELFRKTLELDPEHEGAKKELAQMGEAQPKE